MIIPSHQPCKSTRCEEHHSVIFFKPLTPLIPQKPIFIFLITLFFSGCLHTSQMQQTQFSSLITSSGLKLFEMNFPGPKPAMLSRKAVKASDGWSDKKVLIYLESILAENKYCRSGYLILGRYAGETIHKIRGECKEPANEDDKVKYPNTIERW